MNAPTRDEVLNDILKAMQFIIADPTFRPQGWVVDLAVAYVLLKGA